MSGLGSVLEVTVASRDLERQVRFCRDAFQLEPVARQGEAVLLGVPGSSRGRLRLVRAAVDPGLPAPEVWESGLQLLGMYSQDVPRTEKLVAAAGGRPRPHTSFDGGPMGHYTEGSARGFDDITWVYPCPSKRLPSPAFASEPSRLHSELHYVAVTTSDVSAALAFFAAAGGMTVIMDQEVEADWICELVGVPSGTKVRLACLAGADLAPTRLIINSYHGAQPTTDAVPGRTVGIRRITFAADPAALQEQLVGAGGIALGNGLLRGPAGIEIELRAPGRAVAYE